MFYFFLTTESWGAFVDPLHIDSWTHSEILVFPYILLAPFPRPLGCFETTCTSKLPGLYKGVGERKEGPVVVCIWDVVGPCMNTWNLKRLSESRKQKKSLFLFSQ